MFSGIADKMKRRMFFYKPKRFSDHHEYATFFDVRHDLFSGDDMMVLEYSSAEIQEKIFQHAIEKFDLKDKSLLDVGCGLGYLKKHLDAHAPGYRSYHGVDLSTRLLEGARQRFGDFYERRDVLVRPFAANEFDVVFLLSVLGYPVTKDPFAYMTTLLRELYRVARVGLVFTHLAPGRRQENSDFTVAPEAMADWCRQNLSPNVTLDDALELVTYAVAVGKAMND